MKGPVKFGASVDSNLYSKYLKLWHIDIDITTLTYKNFICVVTRVS